MPNPPEFVPTVPQGAIKAAMEYAHHRGISGTFGEGIVAALLIAAAPAFEADIITRERVRITFAAERVSVILHRPPAPLGPAEVITVIPIGRLTDILYGGNTMTFPAVWPVNVDCGGGALCWTQPLNGPLIACDRKIGHRGKHSWEDAMPDSIVTVITDGGEKQFAADEWAEDDEHNLTVTRNGRKVAGFRAGAWHGVHEPEFVPDLRQDDRVITEAGS